MQDYIILFRCFKGPGYWGHFKNIKAKNPSHATEKMQRIQQGYFANHGVNGEFRVEPGYRYYGRGS